MKVCVYDNPATMCREGWKDGKLLAHITRDLMETKGFIGHPTIPFYLNQGPWQEGRIIGDKDAMQPLPQGEKP